MPNNTEHALALLLVVLVTAAHLRSLRFTGAFQATATGMTILLILGFIFIGFGHGPAQPVTFLPHAADCGFPVLAAFWGSLIYVMYSYSGWNAAAYIVEEVRDSAKALPRALILGTTFVIGLYVAVNAVFLYTTPLTALAGKLEVAHIAGGEIFGEAGARITSALICVGLVANVSGMIWVGSRVTEAMGATYPAARPSRAHDRDARAVRGAALPIRGDLRPALFQAGKRHELRRLGAAVLVAAGGASA